MLSVGIATKDIKVKGGIIKAGSEVYPVELLAPIYVERGIIQGIEIIHSDETAFVHQTNVADGKELFYYQNTEGKLIPCTPELVKPFGQLLKRAESTNGDGGRQGMLSLITTEILKRRELAYHVKDITDE